MQIYSAKALLDIKTKTHRTHPDTSREAAERVQPHVSRQAVSVLAAINMYGPCTAKVLDNRMAVRQKFLSTATLFRNWNQRAQRRMCELEKLKLVSRDKYTFYTGLMCTITKAGIEYLESLSGSKKG